MQEVHQPSQGMENYLLQSYCNTEIDEPSLLWSSTLNFLHVCRFISEFDDIRKLGKGGFGRVYTARKVMLNKEYAVKIVRARE